MDVAIELLIRIRGEALHNVFVSDDVRRDGVIAKASCEAFSQCDPIATRFVRMRVGDGPEMSKIGRRGITHERSSDICNLLIGHSAGCVFANAASNRLQFALMMLQKQRKRARIARIEAVPQPPVERHSVFELQHRALKVAPLLAPKLPGGVGLFAKRDSVPADVIERENTLWSGRLA
jgi:hypothetical protein